MKSVRPPPFTKKNSQKIFNLTNEGFPNMIINIVIMVIMIIVITQQSPVVDSRAGW